MLIMTPEQIKVLIETGIPGAQAVVEGDDGVHFQASVVSEGFKGISKVGAHQLVYRALGERMQADIHALSIKTYTLEEWEARRGAIG